MATCNLTARELEILIGYVKEANGTVDWNKVAATTNCKTGKYARDKFALIRQKLLAAAPGDGADTTNGAANGDGAEGAAATPNGKAQKKGTPRKRKNASDADDEETPKKSNKKAKTASPEGNGVEVKPEPNEAGELMDDLI